MTNELVEAGMLDGFVFSIEHEQARLVATSQRLLRNQFFRQIVVEFGKPHLRQSRLFSDTSPRARALCAASGNRRSEWIVDAGKDGGAFATPSDVNEADYERLRNRAKSNAADRVQFRERVVA